MLNRNQEIKLKKWKEEESIFKGVDLIRCKIHNWT